MPAPYDIDRLPSTFRFPDARDYASHTVSALSHLGFDSSLVNRLFVPPMRSQVNGLITAVESSAGSTIADVKSILDGVKTQTGLNLAGYAQQLTGMIGALVAGRVDVAVGQMVGLASKIATDVATRMASSLANVIPIIGAMIGAVIDVVSNFGGGKMSASDRQAAEDAAIRVLEGWLAENCPKYIVSSRATSSTGTTPADVFRDVYIAAKLGDMLPPSVASVYVLLCGGESQGVGLTRKEYDGWLNAERKRRRSIGIPYDVQRVMWSIIKAVMSASKDPRMSFVLDMHGDQGRSAYAQLQDIIRQSYFAGQWDADSIRSISRFIGDMFSKTMPYDCGKNCSAVVSGSCANYMGLDKVFMDAQVTWQSVLADHFCAVGSSNSNQQCAKWVDVPSPAALQALNASRARMPTVGRLVIPQHVVNNAIAAASLGAVAGKAALAAAAGVGGFFLVREFL